MARSSLTGIEEAPTQAEGRDEEALGPSDSSDSGSDLVGIDALKEADPNEPVDLTVSRDIQHAPIEGEDSDDLSSSAADITVDRVFTPDASSASLDEVEDDDIDSVDQAMATGDQASGSPGDGDSAAIAQAQKR